MNSGKKRVYIGKVRVTHQRLSGDNLHRPVDFTPNNDSGKGHGPPPPSHGSILSMRCGSSIVQGNAGEGEGVPGSRCGSLVSLTGGDVPVEGEFIQAAAFVSQPALYSKELIDQHSVGPAMVQPSEIASKAPIWAALHDPGVKRALIVGIGIQILQQV
ncbi:tonoplast monosaccharide transporter2 [Actinidia rufa]|uniref:Tonoplast monosaccharide transporter2 n=1 Tax=Actinidia rufa TaxID=165716 RepID=A0A7J0DK72_9ERIC|nr:tonoplast monosaccharide transporter2 [Actinidia rufa]